MFRVLVLQEFGKLFRSFVQAFLIQLELLSADIAYFISTSGLRTAVYERKN